MEQDTFDINVPVVRPDHETTAFLRWFDPASGFGPIGQWQQTLVPPSSDPTFDFSGEKVQELAAGQAGPDSCWFSDARIGRQFLEPFNKVTNPPDKPWKVAPGNTYDPDIVGYFPGTVCYYRNKSPTFKQFGTCGSRVEQEMGIHAPSDPPPFDPPTTYTPYGSTNLGDLNALAASMTKPKVFSERAGMSLSFPYGTGPVCPLD